MLVRTSLAIAAVLFAAGAFAPAHAQNTPNADQIVKSLTPTDNMGNATRGIRIGNAPSGHSGAAAAATAAGPSVSLNVEFATGSADLTPTAMQSLDQLGQALASPTLAAYHFRVEGHTDTVGSAGLNKTLSERRAEAVVSYLTSKYGIDPSRLRAIGMGENGLLVATPPQTPEARNRRVLVVNIGS
ncbi:MAG TPA: OmpA family protein [Acetobacteraceae bacterium]|nr:OmpA family protein [Acetobacteraceae bacterium]